jgi:hypothetical protein
MPGKPALGQRNLSGSGSIRASTSGTRSPQSFDSSKRLPDPRSLVTLFLGDEQVVVTKPALALRVPRFTDIHRPECKDGKYIVTTQTTADCLKDFVQYLEQTVPPLVTAENQAALLALADEFGGDLTPYFQTLVKRFQDMSLATSTVVVSDSADSGQLSRQISSIVKDVESAIDTLRTQDQQREDRLASLELQVEESRYHQSRLSDVESTMRSLQSQLAAFQKNFSTTKDDLIKLHQFKIGEFEKRTLDMEQNVSTRLAELKKEEVGFRTEFDQIKAEIARLATNVTDRLSRDIASIKSEISGEYSQLFRVRPQCFVPCGTPMQGILAHFRQIRGQNPVDAGIVSFGPDRTDPTTVDKLKLLFEEKGATVALSGAGKAFTLTLCFKGVRIRPSHYAIRVTDGATVKGWVINGCVEGESDKWVQLDEVKDTSKSLLKGPAAAVFPVANSVECVALQFVASTKNKDTVMTGFELFGMVYEDVISKFA